MSAVVERAAVLRITMRWERFYRSFFLCFSWIFCYLLYKLVVLLGVVIKLFEIVVRFLVSQCVQEFEVFISLSDLWVFAELLLCFLPLLIQDFWIQFIVIRYQWIEWLLPFWLTFNYFIKLWITELKWNFSRHIIHFGHWALISQLALKLYWQIQASGAQCPKPWAIKINIIRQIRIAIKADQILGYWLQVLVTHLVDFLQDLSTLMVYLGYAIFHYHWSKFDLFPALERYFVVWILRLLWKLELLHFPLLN